MLLFRPLCRRLLAHGAGVRALARRPSSTSADGHVLPTLASSALSPAQQELLQEERRTLFDLERVVSRAMVGGPLATSASREALQAAVRSLDEPFLLVVVGEFNAGKSSFINALLGQAWLREGVTPTTHEVHLVSYAPEPSEERVEANVLHLRLPSAWLRDIVIVDTPGVNAVIQRHETITRTFVPRADLVLFLTSVDRPFSESERAFLASIAEWGKKIVVAVNKADTAREAERRQVMQFVSGSIRRLLGLEPACFAISTRRLPDGSHEPGFVALRAHIEAVLASPERTALKFRSPLGVGDRVLAEASRALAARRLRLETDCTSVELLAELQTRHRARLTLAYPAETARLASAFAAAAERADSFLAAWLTPVRTVGLLFGSARFTQAFARDVLGPLAESVPRLALSAADWLDRQEQAFLREADGYLSTVEPSHLRVAAEAASGMELTSRREELRAALVAQLMQMQLLPEAAVASASSSSSSTSSSGAATTPSAEQRGAALASDASSAAVRMLAVQGTALSAGAAASLVVDVVLLPWLAGAAVAVAALGLIPSQRWRLAREVRASLDSARAHAQSLIDDYSRRQAEAAAALLAARAAPFTQYVRARTEAQQAATRDLATLRAQLAALGTQVSALHPVAKQ